METDAPLLGEPVPVELMNTIWADRDGVHDALDTPDRAQAWLAAIAPRLDGVVAEAAHPAADAVAAELRSLRDALRRLAADATGDPRPVADADRADVRRALDHLNAAASGAPRWVSLEWPTGRSAARRGTPARTVHTAASVEQARVAQIAELGVELFAAPEGLPLRACLAPGCVLYFVRSHARREWCSAACGNRARVARHYQRHHSGA